MFIEKPSEDPQVLQGMKTLQAQSGLQGIVVGLEHASEKQKETAGKLLLVLAKNNPVELLTDHLLQAGNSWGEYASLCQWLLLPHVTNDTGRELILESGVLSFWILQSLRVSEGTNQMQISISDRI